MLGKLMVNTVDDGNSCGERLNELVVIGTDEIVCNDEPYYPVRVERSHMDDIAKAVNSHHAMKEALENCLEVVGSWDEEPEWVLQAKKALTLANGGSTDE